MNSVAHKTAAALVYSVLFLLSFWRALSILFSFILLACGWFAASMEFASGGALPLLQLPLAFPLHLASRSSSLGAGPGISRACSVGLQRHRANLGHLHLCCFRGCCSSGEPSARPQVVGSGMKREHCFMISAVYPLLTPSRAGVANYPRG